MSGPEADVVQGMAMLGPLFPFCNAFLPSPTSRTRGMQLPCEERQALVRRRCTKHNPSMLRRRAVDGPSWPRSLETTNVAPHRPTSAPSPMLVRTRHATVNVQPPVHPPSMDGMLSTSWSVGRALPELV
ncbi:hypothetical protein RJ55_02154 [Drechmeria coniospora]|nr:hypothetical protein RJ55_02154 [Drechmeria coniospora]